MGRAPYGRPYRRRKAASFYPGVACSICGQPIRTRAEFTLHHTVPVSRGGAFSEQPAHVACDLQHGGRLGGETSAAHRDGLEPGPPDPAPRVHVGRSRYPQVWEGALAIALNGPCLVHKQDGTVVLVESGQRYIP